VEDHSLENAPTRLPNRRYLDIWLKTHLYLARRRGESMAAIQWRIPEDSEGKALLREISNSLRGEDLLTDLGEDCLLLLPGADLEGTQILLERIRSILGPIPMGATLWQPEHPVDRDDLFLQQALLRTSEARRYSQEMGQNGQGDVQWMLLMADSESEDAQS
jgi:GGDEF domain-containing protein